MKHLPQLDEELRKIWTLVQKLHPSMWGCDRSPCSCVGSHSLGYLRHGAKDEGPVNLCPLYVPFSGVEFLFVKCLLSLIHPTKYLRITLLKKVLGQKKWTRS